MSIRGFLFTTAVAAYGYFILFNRIERNEFDTFILIAFINFLIYLYLCFHYKTQPKLLLAATLLFHVVVFFSEPNYSEDYFRFLWDGHLQKIGINPYEFTPSKIIESGQSDVYLDAIYPKLNSKEYYSVYPFTSQLLYRIAAFSDQPEKGLWILKGIVLLGNILLVLSLELLRRMKKIPSLAVYLIAMNPLLIIETSGNLHFEAITIGFFLLGYAFLLKEKFKSAGILVGTAIGIKLLPILLLPLFIIGRTTKKGLNVVIGFIAFSMITLLPFFDWNIFGKIAGSINLYFQSFEFNASIYSIVNYVSAKFSGFNTVAYVGPLLGVLFFGIYIYLLRKDTKKIHTSIFPLSAIIFLLFYILATTVHPWYIIYPLIFSTLSMKWTGVGFSMLVLLSYCHYSNASESTKTILTVSEYIGVGLLIVFEKQLSVRFPLQFIESKEFVQKN